MNKDIGILIQHLKNNQFDDFQAKCNYTFIRQNLRDIIQDDVDLNNPKKQSLIHELLLCNNENIKINIVNMIVDNLIENCNSSQTNESLFGINVLNAIYLIIYTCEQVPAISQDKILKSGYVLLKDYNSIADFMAFALNSWPKHSMRYFYNNILKNIFNDTNIYDTVLITKILRKLLPDNYSTHAWIFYLFEAERKSIISAIQNLLHQNKHIELIKSHIEYLHDNNESEHGLISELIDMGYSIKELTNYTYKSSIYYLSEKEDCGLNVYKFFEILVRKKKHMAIADFFESLLNYTNEEIEYDLAMIETECIKQCFEMLEKHKASDLMSLMAIYLIKAQKLDLLKKIANNSCFKNYKHQFWSYEVLEAFFKFDANIARQIILHFERLKVNICPITREFALNTVCIHHTTDNLSLKLNMMTQCIDINLKLLYLNNTSNEARLATIIVETGKYLTKELNKVTELSKNLHECANMYTDKCGYRLPASIMFTHYTPNINYDDKRNRDNDIHSDNKTNFNQESFTKKRRLT